MRLSRAYAILPHMSSSSLPRASSLPRCSSPSPSSSQTYTPATYRAQRNEVGVFTTPPYSSAIKPFWRYKDEEIARKSAEEIWEVFGRYGELRDFVGMDMARKFIQMGRTRSLRYALRKGGKKYEQPSDDVKPDVNATYQVKRATGERLKVIPRSGEVYDEGKLRGAAIFRSYEDKCWADEVYIELWDAWKAQQGVKAKAKVDPWDEREGELDVKGKVESSSAKGKRPRKQSLIQSSNVRRSKRAR